MDLSEGSKMMLEDIRDSIIRDSTGSSIKSKKEIKKRFKETVEKMLNCGEKSEYNTVLNFDDDGNVSSITLQLLRNVYKVTILGRYPDYKVYSSMSKEIIEERKFYESNNTSKSKRRNN